MAIRDMDIAAEIIGVSPLQAKLSAFAISSFYIGIAGAMFFANYLGAAEVGEAFGIDKSFLVLFMVIIGGLGSILGSFLGAAFLVLLPVAAEKPDGRLSWMADGSCRSYPDHAGWRIDRPLPDCRAARPCAIVAADEGKTAPVAVPLLGPG